jgi:HEAT repeat protein
LAVVSEQSFIEKLEFALDQPEPRVVARAAEVLVRRFDEGRAMTLLLGALRRRWNEAYVAASILRAMSLMEGRVMYDVLIGALSHESIVVRAAAAECLQARPRRAS